MAKKKAQNESWYQRCWRPATAILYLVICAFDFIAMPVYVEMSNNKSGLNMAAFDNIAKFENPAVQAELVKKINVGDRRWEPLTLTGGGLFHLAFGSILTGAAVTRGLQKRDQYRYGYDDSNEDDNDFGYSNFGQDNQYNARRTKGTDPLP